LDTKSPEFYAEIGLASGLEVHEQLLTDRAMFCHCPARGHTGPHDGSVLVPGGLPETEGFTLSHWK
jgi:Asp-tRNA(Asn)/Glu-tRNA(Gln) amidotransferase B subunit